MSKYFIKNTSIKHFEALRNVILDFDKQAIILTGESESEILSVVAKEKPDILFIHLEITDQQTFVIVKKLKQNKQTAAIPIILTGLKSAFQNLEREVSHSEADSFLQFPLDALMFKLQVQKLLKSGAKLRKKLKNEGQAISNLHIPVEDKFRAVFEKSADGILILNEQGFIAEMNQSLEDLTGLNKNMCIGMPIRDFQNKLGIIQGKNRETHQSLKKFVDELLELRRPELFGRPVELTIRTNSDQTRIIEYTYYLVDSFEKHLIVCVFRDITERKLFDDALKNSESKYYGIFDANKDGISIFVINPDETVSNFVEANKAACEMLGYSKKEFLTLNVFDLEVNIQNDSFVSRIEALKNHKHVNIETELRHKAGHTVNVDIIIAPILYNNQIAIMNIVRDISERKKAEKVIADERILLRTLIDNIPDLIYVKDTTGRKIISNKADLELMSLSDEKDFKGKANQEIHDQEFAARTYADDMNVIKSGQAILNKIEFLKCSNGEEKYFSISKVPLSNESGEITGLVGIGHDITKRRKTEQKIIQLSKGIEQSPASVIITDTQGNIEYANSKLTEITGYTFEEIEGKNPRIFQSGYTSEEEYAILWKTILEGNEYRNEIQNRKRNGELFWESVLISPIRNELGEIVNFLAIKEDITDRKKADLEIQKLSVAIEQNPASVIITNTEGIIEYVNKKFISVSGYTKKELIGTVVRILKPGHTPDQVYIEIWNKLFAGQEWRGEHQNRTKKREYYWESVLISPIRNQEGKTTNFIIVSEDISERKKMEKDLISAKEKAEESDRLKSAFLANMSHEIRTPLNSILGFSDLLTEPDIDPESRNEFADLINSSGNNLLAIINDVLDISKIEAGQIVLVEMPVNAQRLITEIQKEYSYKARDKQIEFKLAANIETTDIILMSDEMRIKQVLINFVGNAIKFTEKGYVEIGVRLKNDTILFHVKDTGIGIAKEYHEKVFDRFRQVEASPSRKYGGNGLGLAITKNLGELLGGKIWLESVPDKGSTFYFALPQSLIIQDSNVNS
jgi:PAS domain S-box-containing protein